MLLPLQEGRTGLLRSKQQAFVPRFFQARGWKFQFRAIAPREPRYSPPLAQQHRVEVRSIVIETIVIDRRRLLFPFRIISHRTYTKQPYTLDGGRDGRRGSRMERGEMLTLARRSRFARPSFHVGFRARHRGQGCSPRGYQMNTEARQRVLGSNPLLRVLLIPLPALPPPQPSSPSRCSLPRRTRIHPRNCCAPAY